MKVFVPEYYNKFKCIADKCRHSCCIGWEIDIDDKSFDKYMEVKGNLGEKLKKCISKEKDSCFILGEDERCPFLNNRNLCEIYIELGEENLCDICKEHPRFRNFFGSRTEMGLGLCCEAAAGLILGWEKRFALYVVDENGDVETEADEENVLFALRDKAFEIIQNKEKTAEECVDELLEAFGINFSQQGINEWIDIFLSLEILDPGWPEILEAARNNKETKKFFFESEKGQNVQRQLLLYFLYRHMADGIYDGTLCARVAFSVLGLEMIKSLCSANEKTDFDTFKDIARRYSAEIEYNEENTGKLIDVLMFV